MTTPLLAPPEAQPGSRPEQPARLRTESLARPFRLGLAGLGAALGLFARLLAANGFGELNSQTVLLGVAGTSAIIGLALLLIAAERDRFGASLVWISGVTAVAWGALNWISPPFADEVTVWSKPDQAVLAVVGVGNGLLLAGIVALAFVRRHPTLTVGATLLAGAFALASSTVALRAEWPAIVCLAIAFALILLAWDRSPRHELAFDRPPDPPRVSRAALSFLAVALCGTAIQLWLSRMDIPRSIPAVVLCGLLLAAAFATLIRVRREIEQRETTLSEWTSWMREIRTNDFRAEMENFESPASVPSLDPRPPVGDDGEAPRPLSFPNLVVADTAPPEESATTTGLDLDLDLESPDPTADSITPESLTSVLGDLVVDVPPTETDPAPEIVVPTAAPGLPRIDVDTDSEPIVADAPAAPAAASGGAFSALLAAAAQPEVAGVTDLDAFATWLGSPEAAARQQALVVAIEAMTLDEFESLPPDDAAVATKEIGSYLADVMPNADLVSWIDGPYFIVAHASKTDVELLELNKVVRKALKPTNGVLAFIRPDTNPPLDDLVDQAVHALLQARIAEQRSAGH